MGVGQQRRTDLDDVRWHRIHYDATTHLPTAGTITAMTLVVNSDHTVLQSMTNISTSLADVGAYLSDLAAFRSQLRG